MDASELTTSPPTSGVLGGPGSGIREPRGGHLVHVATPVVPRIPPARLSGWASHLVSYLPFLTFLCIVAAWELLAVVGIWNVAVFPGPGRVLASSWELLRTGVLVKHAIASLFRVTVGYYLAVALGLPLGILLGQWRSGREASNSLIQFLRPISPLAWIPLAMLWFGIGDKPAVFLIFLASFFPLVVSTIDAVGQINSTYFRVAANFGLSSRERITKVIVPAILPGIMPALRISLGVAWLVVVAAEMIAVKSGLGYLILDARNALRMDIVITSMIAIGLIGVVLDRVISRLSHIESMSWGLR